MHGLTPMTNSRPSRAMCRIVATQASPGRERRRDPDVHALRVEVKARQRHVVLPADQPAEPAERRRDRSQRRPVAHSPDGPLRPGRHQLAVGVRERPVRGEVQERVVDRPAVALVDAHDQPDAGFAGDVTKPCRRRARHDDRLVGEQRVPLVVTVPDPCGVDPHGRPREERLGKDDELGAVGGGAAGEFSHSIERRVQIHEDRRRLYRRDSKHARILSRSRHA